MSGDTPTTPRLVYRGPEDETAETCEVADAAALDKAIKNGYRLTRVAPAKAKADVKDKGTK